MRPKEPDQDEATTPIGELRPSARKSGLCVRVTVDGQTRTLTLPEVGVVTVGRSRDADVFIDHASVSRRHAQLQIGSRLTVQDLGSQNGTILRGARLAPHDSVGLALGDAIAIGVAMLAVHPAESPAHHEEAASGLRRDIRSFERDRIQKALQDCGGNQTKAARMLGISRRTLVSRLTEYGLPRPKK